MYMYIAPGHGRQPPGDILFHKYKYSVYLPISCKFCPLNHILTIFPIQMHGPPMLALSENMSRSSKGHDAWETYADFAVTKVKVIPEQ